MQILHPKSLHPINVAQSERVGTRPAQGFKLFEKIFQALILGRSPEILVSVGAVGEQDKGSVANFCKQPGLEKIYIYL